MIGIALAIGVDRWEASQTREHPRAFSEGVLNTALGTIGTLGLFTVAASSALRTR